MLFRSRYRAQCAADGWHNRSIEFFKKIVDDRPDDHRARIQLACAYVDKIPTCGGMAAIVGKGTLARRSLDQLNQAIVHDRDSWVAYYCRGMNHLHWPRALRHSEDAAVDLQKCVELQERGESSTVKDYFMRTYILLGDAWAKAGKYARARETWRRGLSRFPDAKELVARLEISDDATLLQTVETQRSLEQPIDTDLSFLDREP